MKLFSAKSLLATSALLGCGLLPCGTVSAAPAAAAAFTCNGVPDTLPPVLNGISFGGAPNALVPGTFVAVTLNISDDCAGVASGVIAIQSPSGKQHFQVANFVIGGAPLNVVTTQRLGNGRSSSVPVGPNGFVPQFYRWSERGTWTVTGITLYDHANNASFYETADLTGIGGSSFFVSNTLADMAGPALIDGVIQSPASLSSPSPLAKVTLRFAERGNPTRSGLDQADVQFCLNPHLVGEVLTCDDQVGVAVNLGVPSSGGTVVVQNRLQSQLFGGVLPTPGVYDLCAVGLLDLAGNRTDLVSPACLGTSDVNALFPLGTKLHVVP